MLEECVYSLENLLRPKTRIGVVMVDMQDGFFDDLEPTRKQSMIDNHIDLLTVCKKRKTPVVSVIWKRQGPESSLLPKYRRRRFQKNDENAFTERKLAPYLRSRNVDTVFVTGLYTDACVKSTMQGALREGFTAVTASDVISNAWGTNIWQLRNGIYLQSYVQILPLL